MKMENRPGVDRQENKTDNRKDGYPVITASGRMLVRFLSYRDQTVRGCLENAYLDKPLYFTGLDHMLLLMENIMDRVDFPQITVKYRNWERKTFEKQTDVVKREDGQEREFLFEDSREEEIGLHEKLAVIQIYFRRNSSMQGEIKINNDKAYFRSGMELMRLIYAYLESRKA